MEEIQQAKMTIEVEVAFLRKETQVVSPNMEAMLRTFFKKEGCNGYALYGNPKVTIEGKLK